MSCKSLKVGFSLLEVMIALAISSVLMPGILMMSMHVLGLSYNSTNRIDASADARRLHHYFTSAINASVLVMQSLDDDGNSLQFKRYDDVAQAWPADSNAAFYYLEEQQRLVYYPDLNDMSAVTVIAENVCTNGANPIFEVTAQGVHCNLLIGEDLEDTSGFSVTFARVQVDFWAAPRCVEP